MRKYNIINNTLGWLVFVVASITYLLTIEPTASFWDCPEFIAQGFKLEIGHPPGNPVFILAARFAANFAGGDVAAVSKCINAMSALLSAATILLLFWTITHLVKKLVVTDGEEDSMTLAQYLVVMGSGIAGALAYTWSDTFWFSAVEAEVYAFSSFCTALVFWLILKWENRADDPGSDKWLILIAYVFGVSLGVHLLNLLCIPAIALVFYYRKWSKTTAKGSIYTLLVSFVLIVLILYGLEPGFVELAGYFELLFVNSFGMPYNSGTLFYAVLLVAVLCWSLYELYSGRSETRMRISFLLGVLLSGIPFIGDSLLIPLVIMVALAWYLFKYLKKVPVRIFSNAVLCILTIFIGFSSYALVLIRSDANTPLDENSPNSPFALSSYLSRDQYGKSPLLYGRTLYSDIVYQASSDGTMKPLVKEGRTQYAREVKTSTDQADHYVSTGKQQDYVYSPEQNMLFPRIHDAGHESEYRQWLNLKGTTVEATTKVDAEGNPIEHQQKLKPTFLENLRWFVDYQLNYMYWRYFMWNFAGRQNDIQGMGEITQGNWITGIPVIDNARLGDQSLMPADLTTGNKGHNVFYCLPLLLGIIGLLWQAYRNKRGIEQFWVIFFLFFMTGIAIVLYLNQTPSQPRERDYAYAGSFYAYAIWIGMGVAGLYQMAMAAIKGKAKKGAKAEGNEAEGGSKATAVAAVAAVIGLLVPVQMVSQTWDDHDRSGRTPARDFGMNYLSSVDQNGVIFCNGDNDTFPLWYAQEVEGYRTDVRVVNLSYLSTDWYIQQMRRAAYESAPLPMQAKADSYAYDNRQYNYFINPDSTEVPALKSLEALYGPDYKNNPYGMPELKYPVVAIPVNADEAVKQGVVAEADRQQVEDALHLNLMSGGQGGMTSSSVMSLDIIASSIAQGWKRPCYFAMTVPEQFYLGLSRYMRLTGVAYEVTPLLNGSGDIAANTDKMYDIVTTKFRWGGMDVAKPGSLYYDETIRRMVATTRTALIQLASDLTNEGYQAKQAKQGGAATFRGKAVDAYIADRKAKALKVLALMDEKMPQSVSEYSMSIGLQVANVYAAIDEVFGDKASHDKAVKVLEDEAMRFASYSRFYQSLDGSMYDRLTGTDRYIDQVYVPGIISAYDRINHAGLDALLKKLTAAGLNVQRTLSYLQAQQGQQAPAQEAAAADTSSPMGGDSVLGSLFGSK